MTRIQVVPKGTFNLYGRLVKREIELWKKGRGTFHRSGPKVRERAKWSHEKHPGWVNLGRGLGDVVVAEVHTKTGPDQEWLLLSAFLGFLLRHFREHIQAVSLQFE